MPRMQILTAAEQQAFDTPPVFSNRWCWSLQNYVTVLVFYRLNSAIERGTKPEALGTRPDHWTNTL